MPVNVPLPQDVGNTPADTLAVNGAILKLKISPPPGSQGTPQTVNAMIDTGASISGILPSIAQAAGLVQTSSADIGGVTGSQQSPIYAATVDLPDYNIHFDAISMAGVDLPQQSIQALIGRDMLEQMNLNYQGPTGTFVLTKAVTAQSGIDIIPTAVGAGLALAALASLFAIARVDY